MSGIEGQDRSDPAAGNTFAQLVLDRAARRRRDDRWVRERLRDPSSRFVPIWDSRVLVSNESSPRPILLGPQDAHRLLEEEERAVLLGEAAEHTYFAVALIDREGAVPPPVEHGEFRSLRRVAALLERGEAGLLAYAKAMITWHQRHQYCGDCGSATRSAQGGHLRVCTNERCGRHHFPRTDPAIIVQVTHGSQCLLGRQPGWPEGFYSIIAGFVEPGENLEAAVAREVREETGIQITDIRYHSSQPWPFPSSLMLGFTAQATDPAIRLHDGELEDARWLSRRAIVNELRQGALQLPSEISISHRLIAEWFDAGESGPLKAVLEAM